MLIGTLLICLLGAAAPAESRPYEILRGRVYAEPHGEPLLADVYRPGGEGPFPGVLVVHGGAWAAGNRTQMSMIARRLAESGLVAVTINYRLAPAHPFPAQSEDARAALTWMVGHAQEFGVDPHRIGGWGYSAGAQIVALLATEPVTSGPKLQAVVAGGAPTDFRHLGLDSRWIAFWLGGTRRQRPEAYAAASPAGFISADDPPFFFYHGEQDRVVFLRDVQTTLSGLTAAGVPATLHVVANTGHIGAFLDKTATIKAIEFLQAKLQPPKPAT